MKSRSEVVRQSPAESAGPDWTLLANSYLASAAVVIALRSALN